MSAAGTSAKLTDAEKVARKRHDVESAGFLRNTAAFWRSRVRKLFSKRKEKEQSQPGASIPITGALWPKNLGFGHESTDLPCAALYLARRWAHPKLSLDSEEIRQQSIRLTTKVWWLMHMLEGNIPCALPTLSYRHTVIFYNVTRLFQNVDFSGYQRLTPPRPLIELVEYWMNTEEFQALENDHYPLDVKTLKHLLDEKELRCFELPRNVAIGQLILEWMEMFALSKSFPILKSPEYVLKRIPKNDKYENPSAQELTDFFITFRPIYLSPEFLAKFMSNDFMAHLLDLINKLDANVSAIFVTDKEEPAFYNVSLTKFQVDILIREFFLEDVPAQSVANAVSSNCCWSNYDFNFLNESIIRPPRQFTELWDKFGKRFENIPKANEPSTNQVVVSKQESIAKPTVVGQPAHHMRKVEYMTGRRQSKTISSSESSMDRLYSSDSDLGMDLSFGADESMDIDLPEVQ